MLHQSIGHLPKTRWRIRHPDGEFIILLRPAKVKESSRELDERAPIDPEPGSLSGKRRSRKDVQPLASAAKVRSTGAKLALVPTTAKGDDKGRKSRRRS